MNPALKDIPPVLILDDDTELLSVLKEQLSWEGYSVVTASTSLVEEVSQTSSAMRSSASGIGLTA